MSTVQHPFCFLQARRSKGERGRCDGQAATPGPWGLFPLPDMLPPVTAVGLGRREAGIFQACLRCGLGPGLCSLGQTFRSSQNGCPRSRPSIYWSRRGRKESKCRQTLLPRSRAPSRSSCEGRISPPDCCDHNVALRLTVVAHALQAIHLGQVVDDSAVVSVHGREGVALLTILPLC